MHLELAPRWRVLYCNFPACEAACCLIDNTLCVAAVPNGFFLCWSRQARAVFLWLSQTAGRHELYFCDCHRRCAALIAVTSMLHVCLRYEFSSYCRLCVPVLVVKCPMLYLLSLWTVTSLCGAIYIAVWAWCIVHLFRFTVAVCQLISL